jgi:hypothetical protein
MKNFILAILVVATLITISCKKDNNQSPVTIKTKKQSLSNTLPTDSISIGGEDKPKPIH